MAVATEVDAVLTLTINGRAYRLTLDQNPTAFVPQRFIVAALDSTKQYAVWRNHRGVLACSCPHYTHRRRCKHLSALRKVGLL